MQLALLTATVKLFIKRPTAGQELVPKVLKWATEEVDNPDLRDRGYIYWRLLSTDPAAAKVTIIQINEDRGDKQYRLLIVPAIYYFSRLLFYQKNHLFQRKVITWILHSLMSYYYIFQLWHPFIIKVQPPLFIAINHVT